MKSCCRGDCGKPLTRKQGETSWNFNHRNFCDKTCAAIVSNRRRVGVKKPRLHKHTVPIIIESTKSLTKGISYIPGSPEFKRLADMYQNN